MAMLTARNVPDEVHRALRVRAAQHGRSMEAEVVGVNYLGRSASIILAGEAKCC